MLLLETYRRYVIGAVTLMNETKEKILLKALQYFTENDYEGVSLTNIARAIGITKGGIYHYFESKDELYHECMIFMLDALEKISMEMVSPDITLEQLIYGLFSFDELFGVLAQMFQIDLLNDYFNYAYLMFVGIKKFPDLKEKVAGIYRTILDEVEKALRTFQTCGEVDPSLDCKALSFELGSMMEGAMLIAGLNKDRDMRELGERMSVNVLKMIK